MLSGHLTIIPDKRLSVHKNRALRVVAGSRCPYSTESVDSVYVRLHILRVEQITLFQAGELLYKHAIGQLPSAFVNYFTSISRMNPYNLRSSGNYRHVYPRTNLRKFSIKHIGPRARGIHHP